MAVVLAILPVFLIIFLGALIYRLGLLSEAFWAGAERITYFGLFPALLVSTLATADLRALEALPMAGAIVAALAVMTLLLFTLRRALADDGPGFTAMVQGSLRQNTYIGLAVSFGLYGEPGLSAAAVAVATMAPIGNTVSTFALARFGRRVRSDALWRGVLVELARNPLVLACLLGILLNLTGIGLPPVIAPMLDILGRAALAFGLLLVGTGLTLGAINTGRAMIARTTGLKLVVLPALVALTCWAFGVGGLAATIAVLFGGMPTATNAYILARQLGGDAELTAGIITVQTALSMISLPILLSLLALVV